MDPTAHAVNSVDPSYSRAERVRKKEQDSLKQKKVVGRGRGRTVTERHRGERVGGGYVEKEE
eukprot:3175081-Rhodomonas_salina.3